MNSKFKVWVCALLPALLFGCGGGGGGGTGGTGVVVVSSGVMTKGSVILNGVRYDDTAANVVIDDKPKFPIDLRDGMVVQVRGRIAERGGTAQQVEAQIEVRGTAEVTALGVASRPQTFVVLGQTVIVDDFTVMSGTVARNPLIIPFDINLNAVLVEVHGLRDSGGRIRATRVEANTVQMADNAVDEIRGVVKNLPAGAFPKTFTLGTQTILVNSVNLITPAGATLANDIVVEVHCLRNCINLAGQFVASKVDVESAEDSAFQPGMNQRFEVEGLISEYSLPTDNDFIVAGVRVTTSDSTKFEGGLSTDMADNIKVEAEGVWNGTALVASKIEFKRSVVRLQGFVTVSTAPTFMLNVAGRLVSVEADSFTIFTIAVPPVNSTTCVQVRGQRKAGGAVLPPIVTAGEIRNCGNGDKPVIQAPVEAESGTTLTLLGFAMDVGNPIGDPPYVDLNGLPLTPAQFFAAVAPANPGPPVVAGTLVKVIFDAPLVVKQVELED